MKERKTPSLTSLVVFGMILMLPVLYVLSYAPLVSGGQVTCGGSAVYRPVDQLIDNTPLREPLMEWAEIWDVRLEFGNAWVRRATQRADSSFRDRLQ